MPSPRASIAVVLSLTAVGGLAFAAPGLDARQRTVRISTAHVTTDASTGSASAFLTVENGTMYEVYIVGASSDDAATVDLMQTTAGKVEAVAEVLVPAFDRLEMSPTGVFLRLTEVKRLLHAGDKVTIALKTDTGEHLSIAAVVR
jgi:copper(I)-binding protein